MRFQDILYTWAHRTPDAVALRWIDRDRQVTYAEAVTQMERVAGGFAALGITRATGSAFLPIMGWIIYWRCLAHGASARQ